MDVGIRELKAKLSEYVGIAAEGTTIVVTDRGTPVARLVALSDDDTVARGIDEGWIEPARRTGLTPAKRVRASRSVMEMLDEDRG
ncbi:MAG: type II toxin-antitoxin system prevent-host-death family antitoxin [Actinomycetota bacterium]